MKKTLLLNPMITLISLLIILNSTLLISQEYVYTVGGIGQESGFGSFVDNKDSTYPLKKVGKDATHLILSICN